MNRKIVLFFTILIILSAARQSAGQICYGSTGQPTFSNTFTGGTFTGYTSFSPTASKPFLGAYTFTSSTAELDANWRNETAATGDRIVVFNVPPTPGIIYRETFTTLCASTTYSLRLIGGGLEKYGEQTMLDFSVRTTVGTVKFQCYTSLSNFSNSEYGVTFITPPTGGNVEITVTGQAARGDNSWFGLSGIVLANCGPAMRAISDYNSNSQNVVDVCEGDTKTFHFSLETASDYPDPYYQWQTFDNTANRWVDIYGATSKAYTYNLVNAVAGKYLFRVNSGSKIYKNIPTCNSNSGELTLTVSKNPIAVAILASAACEGETIVLNGSGGNKYFWTGPNGFTSTVQNPEINNVSGINSGVYHLTVSQNNCSSTTSINVLVNAKPVISAGADQVICKGDKISLTATGGVSYEWTPATGLSDPHIANPVAAPLITTKYKITGFNAAGCESETSVLITVNQQPTADAGRDRQIYQNEPVKLNGKAENSSGFYWTPSDFLSDTRSLTPVATPAHDIVYTLHVLPLAGCSTEITDEVFLKTVVKVIVPSAFTPNGDQVNDVWFLKGLDTYTGALVQIFNRNGALLFQNTRYNSWDGKFGGKPLPAGTYYYRIDLKNGVLLSGPVTIIR